MHVILISVPFLILIFLERLIPTLYVAFSFYTLVNEKFQTVHPREQFMTYSFPKCISFLPK